MILVVMAAGMGSRYGGMKQIDPIGEGGEFILDYSVYDAKRAGFDKVVFVIKPELYEDFENTIGKRIKGMSVSYAYQRLDDIPSGAVIPEGRVKPWGTAHAVYAAREFLTENFAVINADDFYGRASFEVVGDYLKGATAGRYCMAGFRLENTVTEYGTVSRGVCSVNGDGELTGIVERTKIGKLDGGFAYYENGEPFPLAGDTVVSMNIWGFTPDFVQTLQNGFKAFLSMDPDALVKAEYYLPTAVREAMECGSTVKVLKTNSKWFGVTYCEDRDSVVSSVRELVARGEYGNILWR